MASAPMVVRTRLSGSISPRILDRLSAPDAIYASLHVDDPELRRTMPWTGTRTCRSAMSGGEVDL